jgi:hypothetical protein
MPLVKYLNSFVITAIFSNGADSINNFAAGGCVVVTAFPLSNAAFTRASVCCSFL